MSLPRRVPAPVGRQPRRDAKPLKVRTLHSVRSVLSRPFVVRRRDRLWQSALPDFAMSLSRDLRTGTSIDRALVDAVAANDAPAHMQMVVARVRSGQPIGEVIARWSDDASSESEQLLVTALAIALRAGAQLGPVLDGLAVALRDELALDARRRVLLVQAQVSALVLVAMPVAFALLSSIVRGGVAFSGVTGLVLLTGGIGLDGIGVVWMRRLLRGLQ